METKLTEEEKQLLDELSENWPNPLKNEVTSAYDDLKEIYSTDTGKSEVLGFSEPHDNLLTKVKSYFQSHWKDAVFALAMSCGIMGMTKKNDVQTVNDEDKILEYNGIDPNFDNSMDTMDSALRIGGR